MFVIELNTSPVQFSETPELWKLFQAKRIFVECCLSSNVKCGTVATYNDHHMQKLIRINNPIAICVSIQIKVTAWCSPNHFDNGCSSAAN